jgi:hypothetical protein
MIRLAAVMVPMIGMGRRVESTRVQRVAPSDALDPEPTTTQCAEALDAGSRVVRARRLESAGGAEQTRERHLVEANQEQKRPPDHGVASGRSFFAARFNSLNSEP